jgi:drug/metabolite transporter (DMT)-like permease
MSLESVIATLSGWLLLKQNMSIRETAGCILMFIAIILAQLPDRKNNKL